MGSTFTMCMNCACNEEDVAIYKCNYCEKIYCYVCSNTGIFSTKCPSCNEEGSILGIIG